MEHRGFTVNSQSLALTLPPGLSCQRGWFHSKDGLSAACKETRARAALRRQTLMVVYGSWNFSPHFASSLQLPCQFLLWLLQKQEKSMESVKWRRNWQCPLAELWRGTGLFFRTVSFQLWVASLNTSHRIHPCYQNRTALDRQYLQLKLCRCILKEDMSLVRGFCFPAHETATMPLVS